MDTLPVDLLVVVCRDLTLPEAESLLATCRTLHTVPDTFYHALAVEWWGNRFWLRALHRKTRHRYHGMHSELRILHGFECALRHRDLPTWTYEDYYAWWRCEADYLRQQQEPPSLDTVLATL